MSLICHIAVDRTDTFLIPRLSQMSTDTAPESENRSSSTIDDISIFPPSLDPKPVSLHFRPARWVRKSLVAAAAFRRIRLCTMPFCFWWCYISLSACLGKVHGSLARAGKVKNQTPKVSKQEKKKALTGRAKKRMQFNRRFVSVLNRGRKGPNSQSIWMVLFFCVVTAA